MIFDDEETNINDFKIVRWFRFRNCNRRIRKKGRTIGIRLVGFISRTTEEYRIIVSKRFSYLLSLIEIFWIRSYYSLFFGFTLFTHIFTSINYLFYSKCLLWSIFFPNWWARSIWIGKIDGFCTEHRLSSHLSFPSLLFLKKYRSTLTVYSYLVCILPFHSRIRKWISRFFLLQIQNYLSQSLRKFMNSGNVSVYLPNPNPNLFIF